MPKLENIELTKADFDASNWQDLIAEIPEKSCEEYRKKFFEQARVAQESGRITDEGVYALLSGICSMRLEPESKEIFRPFLDIQTMRSFILDDLTENHITILVELLPSIRDSEMKARIADILWVKNRSYFAVDYAVNGYIDSAKWMLHSSYNLKDFAIDYIQRALWLAKSVSNTKLFDNSFKIVKDFVISHDIKDYNFPFARILRVLLGYATDFYDKFADLCKKLALDLIDKGDWIYVANYWEIKSKWDELAGETDAKRCSLIESAEAHVKAGMLYANATKPQYHAAEFQLRQAIDILRNLGGMQKRCDEIHKLYTQYQKLSMNDFEKFSIEGPDITEYIQQSLMYVKDRNLRDAIIRFVFCSLPLQEEDISRLVEQYFDKASSYLLFFATAKLDDDGKTIDTAPSPFMSSEEDKNKAFRAKVYEQVITQQSLGVQATLAPMLYQISQDHNIRMNDLVFIVQNNPFIPPNHAYIFLKGIHAGFHGDYLVAMHLLIPQLENSFRYILSQKGITTSSLDTKTGIQENYRFETLLDMPELKEMIGDDMVFNLKSLLIRKFGANLRNNMAHGLIPSSRFQSTEMIYTFWLILRLCFYGIPSTADNISPNDE